MELALWVLLCCVSVSRAERHTVFWNSTNPKFQEDVYSVQVHLNDYLDIVCPHYPQGTVPSQEAERYVLYMVELEDFETCRPQSYEQMRWECGQPFALHAPEKFSEKFQRFTPFTLGKEFRPGQSYYYISKPLHHHGQECLKLRVDVIANDGSQEARVGPGKGSRGGGHTTSNHLPADDPVVLPVQKNAPPNCAVRPAFLTIIPALLPFFLLLVVQ